MTNQAAPSPPCRCSHGPRSGHRHIISIIGDNGEFWFPTAPIAIVGSSARLLESNHGKEIDQYEEVIRFNRAPTAGYEEHVGSKTTLRIANNHVFNNNDVERDEGVWGNQPKDFIRDLRDQRILYCAKDMEPWWNRSTNAHSSNELFVVDYPMLEYVREKTQITWDGDMTIGSVIILLSLVSGLAGHLNTESPGEPLLHLYGFDIMDDVKRTHYWETRPEPQGNSHSISFEKRWMRHVIQSNLIKYF